MQRWAKLFGASGAERKNISVSVPFSETFSTKKTMELHLIRRWFTDKSTIGELFVNDLPTRECYTLEPTVRQGADPRGIVAIPEGRYEITIYDSPHFKMRVPIINTIPGHTYVEIHPGNFPLDTHDCILPGTEKGEDMVLNSQEAFMPLFKKIDDALNTTDVYLTIRNQGA